MDVRTRTEWNDDVGSNAVSESFRQISLPNCQSMMRYYKILDLSECIGRSPDQSTMHVVVPKALTSGPASSPATRRLYVLHFAFDVHEH